MCVYIYILGVQNSCELFLENSIFIQKQTKNINQKYSPFASMNFCYLSGSLRIP